MRLTSGFLKKKEFKATVMSLMSYFFAKLNKHHRSIPIDIQVRDMVRDI